MATDAEITAAARMLDTFVVSQGGSAQSKARAQLILEAAEKVRAVYEKYERDDALGRNI